MKQRILQRFDIYCHYYKDLSDGKFYKVSAFDVDPISNRIVRKDFRNADFSKRKEAKDEFKTPRFIETI
jgi:hypothetical protein|tara:strand:- start:629 stop:835 length:207 start_codon:yes stop_codon:yes gene_type:complete